MSKDVKIFNEAIKEMAEDFGQNPFQYVNEEPVIDELYTRLRKKLPSFFLPVEFKTDCSDESNWKVSEVEERVRKKSQPNLGKAARLRREICLIDDGVPIPKQEPQVNHFDVVLFSENNEKLINQSKAMGPGDFWDEKNEISIICEIKHSRNMSNRFYSDKYGAKDVLKLSKLQVETEKRVFLFFDWWPIYKNGKERFQSHIEKLQKNLNDLNKAVTLFYVPRLKNSEGKRIKRKTLD